MEWLIAAGIISLLVGTVLVFSSETLKVIGDFVNKPLGQIDDALRSVRLPAGIALVIVGGWMVSVSLAYPEFWYLYLISITVIAFGLFYLFLGQWLDGVARAADQPLLLTDTLELKAGRLFGIVLVVLALYIFCSVYLMVR
jgi:hypothetical protein